MTIFVDVLVKLIREQLSHVLSNLTTQAKSYSYNHKLSLDQKDIISTLEANMVRFQSTNDDKADSEKFADMLKATRLEIQEVREKHGKPRDEGNTIACLNNLIFHTTGFCLKLKTFSFNLLNRENTNTPENIVYYHACYYFGQEIFDPKAYSDVEIRAKKETVLANRLNSLSELIKPSYTLEEQRKRTLQVLTDLATDNKMVIGGGPSSGLTLPSVTILGLFQVKSPSEWFASPGRLNEQLKSAWRKIEAMTDDTFQPPQIGRDYEPSAGARKKSIDVSKRSDAADEAQYQEADSIKLGSK